MNKEHFDFEAKRIIKNPESEWIYREGLVPQMIDTDLWEKANQQINNRKTVDRKHNVGINKGNNMLSSKIICGECGSKYWRNKRTQGIYWYCSEGARSGKARERTGMKCTSLNLKEDEILSLIQKIGNQLIAKEKKEEVLSNAIMKIYETLTTVESRESVEDIQAQLEKLNNRKDTLMDFLLDGTITKIDYASKIDSITEQITLLNEKKIKVQEKNKENEGLFSRLNQVRDLFQKETEKGIEVPIMCSHIEQIKVFEKRLDVYLDFLKNVDYFSIECDKMGKNSVYNMPTWVGGLLP